MNTSRFGLLEIDADSVIRFPAGLLGLEDCRRWVLVADACQDCLAWLQSLDRAEVALAVVSPRRFVPDYQIRVAREELQPLELDHPRDARVLVIAARTEQGIALNLKAPVVLNLARCSGRQVVTNGSLPVRYEIGSKQPTLRRSA